MSGVNKVIVTGNLTRDPVLKHTADGIPVCDMRMAIVTRLKDSTEDVCYIDLVAWQSQAESCARYLHKGSWILVEGRLKLHQWESKQGQKRSKHGITAHRITFLNADVCGNESGSFEAGRDNPRDKGRDKPRD